jgi:phosphate-selective porin OprO/OprP
VRSNDSRYWAGVYVTGPQSGELHTATGGGSQQFGAFGRFAYQLLQAPDYSLHFGVDAGGLLKPPQAGGVETVTLSDRPELRIDTATILSTGALGTLLTAHNTPVTGAGVYGIETAGGWRNFFAQGEAYEIEIDRAGVPADHFKGGYLEGSWTATGESRKYLPATGAYSGINPDHPFSLSAGTWGAFEFAGRVSFVDLNDNFAANHTGAIPLYNGVSGGRQLIYTAGINWYVNPNMRFMLNYLHGYVKKEATTATAGSPETGADFDEVGMRAQVNF